MGIQGASIELNNGSTIKVESSGNGFTGDLSEQDEEHLIWELKKKILDEYGNESVELAKGARIVMYESANSGRWSPSFWSYLFRPSVTKYAEMSIDPAKTTLIESGAAHLFGTKQPLPKPSDGEARFFEEQLPNLIKNNKARFSQIQGIFRIEMEHGATWILKFPRGQIIQALSDGEGNDIVADCTIRVSQSALKKVMKKDFSMTSYVLDRPEISGNEALAKHLGWLLKELS